MLILEELMHKPIDDYIVPFAQVPGVSITVSYIDSRSVVEARTNAITQPMIDTVFPHIPYREPEDEEDQDLSLY